MGVHRILLRALGAVVLVGALSGSSQQEPPRPSAAEPAAVAVYSPAAGSILPTDIQEESGTYLPQEAYATPYAPPSPPEGAVPEEVTEEAVIEPSEGTAISNQDSLETTVTYCGTTRDILRALDPDAFAGLPEDALPRCMVGTALPGAVILDVPYYNQCSFADSEGRTGRINPCGSGCGPASAKMAFEYAGLGEMEFYRLWESLWTGSKSGTSWERLAEVAEELQVWGESAYNMEPSDIRSHIDSGHVILFNTKSDPDGVSYFVQERYDENAPTTTGHDVLIVGYADAGIIVHDPFTSRKEESFGFGRNLLIRWETLEERIYRRMSPMIAIVPLGQQTGMP